MVLEEEGVRAEQSGTTGGSNCQKVATKQDSAIEEQKDEENKSFGGDISSIMIGPLEAD